MQNIQGRVTTRADLLPIFISDEVNQAPTARNP